MRKIILVAAMVLASASAQADGSRSLSLATANEQVPAAQAAAPTTATIQVSEVAPVPDAPKYVDRQPAVSATAPAAATTTTSAPVATRPVAKTTAKGDKPRHKRWTEGRIIAELHSHGVYW